MPKFESSMLNDVAVIPKTYTPTYISGGLKKTSPLLLAFITTCIYRRAKQII